MIAPPVSLATIVTSVELEALHELGDAGRRRRVGVSGRAIADGMRCEPSGSVGTMQRNAVELGDDLAPERPVDEQAVDEEQRRAVPARVVVVDRPLR